MGRRLRRNERCRRCNRLSLYNALHGTVVRGRFDSARLSAVYSTVDSAPSLRPRLPFATDRYGLLDFRRMRRVYEFSNSQSDPSVIGWGVAEAMTPHRSYYPSVWIDAL